MADELTLNLRRALPAARSAVFSAFSDSEKLARWWGPEGFTIPALEFVPRVGDSYRIEMQPPGSEPFYLRGEFREVEAPSRLAFTFVWDPPDPDDVETVAVLSLSGEGETTEVELTQGPFKTEDRRNLHHDGWTESFDRLERLLGEEPNRV